LAVLQHEQADNLVLQTLWHSQQSRLTRSTSWAMAMADMTTVWWMSLALWAAWENSFLVWAMISSIMEEISEAFCW